MPKFSHQSKTRLMTCDPRIQAIMNRAIEHFDFTVLVGYRGRQDQEKAFRGGKSKARFGQSKHNSLPSMAIDIAPWPIEWQNRDRFHYLAGWIMAMAAMESDGSWHLRWGGDWDSDTETSDNRFDDLGHFEIIEDA